MREGRKSEQTLLWLERVNQGKGGMKLGKVGVCWSAVARRKKAGTLQKGKDMVTRVAVCESYSPSLSQEKTSRIIQLCDH